MPAKAVRPGEPRRAVACHGRPLRGRFGLAVDAALTVLRAGLLRESAHRALPRVDLAEGDLAEARRAYQTCVGVLRREPGVRPTPAATALLRPSLTRPPSPVPDGPLAREVSGGPSPSRLRTGSGLRRAASGPEAKPGRYRAPPTRGGRGPALRRSRPLRAAAAPAYG
ncbi:bacterial transcriptional activator domain-containing protein [Streptomyces sp. NPDC056049]|uniref:bacterial transcriptional activator domain-containing protein n=1 Tax=Streptomyces sp. NPDC056049 TaxID=3345693 RepID=UPI0035DF0953